MLISLLTFILVLDCLLLILLILIQLPKKEAGLGTAFGSSTTDALFGAGTGTALTQITKYAAGIFFIIALTLTVLNNHRSRQSGVLFEKAIQKEAAKAAEVPPPAAAAKPSLDTEKLKQLATNQAASVTTNKTEAKPPAKLSPEAPVPTPSPKPPLEAPK